jgi:D-alanyl-D-alanine carboxypeptidase
LLVVPAWADTLAERLQKIADQTVREDGLTGVVIGIERGDERPLVSAAGLADVATGTPMKPDTAFKAASIGKTFVAALALSLVDDGWWRLDDKLARFAPDVPNADRVSLRELLSHTSGYRDYMTPAFLRDARKELAPAALLALAEPQRLAFVPGTRFLYANTNYLLIRMALGRSAARKIRRRFLEPFGLASTWFAADEPKPISPMARGYGDPDGNGMRPDLTDKPWDLGGADGGLVSTAGDLVRWAAVLYGGRVLAKERHDEMLDFVRYGRSEYGLGVQRFRIGGLELYGHAGSAPGYTSLLLYEPGTKTAIAIAFNQEPSEEALLDILAERVLRAVR